MKPLLVLRPRPEQQPLLAGFVILLVLSVVLPLAGFGTDSFGDVSSWIAFGLACLAVGRPLRSRIGSRPSRGRAPRRRRADPAGAPASPSVSVVEPSAEQPEAGTLRLLGPDIGVARLGHLPFDRWRDL